MFNKPWLTSLKKSYKQKNVSRQQIISASSPLGHTAKKIIFALQRGENQSNRLKTLQSNFEKLVKKYGQERIVPEPSFQAALEEYIEAVFLNAVINKQNISPLKNIEIKADIYLGALSDVTGELVRKVTNLISEGNITEAKRLITAGKMIVDELLDFDMAGNLRTKYDQARNNLRKLEQLQYEISRHQNKEK
jgi:predicted translin family RNA/ssDNA-binding protein